MGVQRNKLCSDFVNKPVYDRTGEVKQKKGSYQKSLSSYRV